MKTRRKIPQSENSGFVKRRLLIVLAVVVLVVLCVWILGGRFGRNDVLLQETKLLLASRNRWYQDGTNATAELPNYTVVGGRGGTVVLINEEVHVDGQRQIAELGWTNSCVGSGVLMVTSSNVFLWREADGSVRKLSMPNLSRIPFWWYLTTP